MHRTGSTCYGIRLDGLVVIDCDADEPRLVSAMEARFGASPVHVRTPRGRHLYYRAPALAQPTYSNLRGEGLPVDVKRGATAYVMGPGSVRPDGGAYLAAKGTLGAVELPILILEAAPSPSRRELASGPVPQGERHDFLVSAAIARVKDVDSPAELLEALRAIRDRDCDAPASMLEAELQGIAEWAWRRRLEGKVYAGRTSEFRLGREALDALQGDPNQSDALALLVRLQDQHGHRPGYAFALDHEGMLKAGLTCLTRRRFRAARDTLLGHGLLQVAALHSAGRRARLYRLCRPLPPSANVAPLHRGGESRRRV